MTDRLRVCLVSPYCWPEVTRGGERYLHDLAWYLTGRGHQVDVVAGTALSTRTTVEDGVRFRRRKHQLPARWAAKGTTAVDTFGLTAAPVLIGHRYDVVHAMAPTAAIAARLAGQRTILTLLGHPTQDQIPVGRRPHYRRLIAGGMRAAHTVTAYSVASAHAAERMFGGRVEALSLGIRIDQFPMRAEPRTGPPRLLFPAFAGERRKGLVELLRALPAVLDRMPLARLELLGGGVDEAVFESIAAEDRERVRNAVDDLGRHADDVSGFYRDATVAVLPSRNEAFGVVLVESLASGTPVVCNDDGGMPEIVSDPAIGRVARAEDPRALSAALLDAIELAALPGTPERCALHARQWDWQSAIGPAHERLYERVASTRFGRAR
jgi:phosphatidylinositol alpha-mannosyltransferase